MSLKLSEQEQMSRFEIVVSAENNHYMVWQAMLFHYSCVTHLGRPPIVMVHKHDEPLVPGFERIRSTGGIVQTAPTYRDIHGVSYPPRNTAGSLKHVETDADYIVLCDPDMLFLEPLPFDKLELSQRKMTFDHCGYLQPDAEVYQPTLDNVCRLAGLDPVRLRQPIVDGGVPHIIPARWQMPLSEAWFEIMELFPTLGTDKSHLHKDWLATMWALVIAAHRLELEPVMTELCVTNCDEGQLIRPAIAAGSKVLHYCYGGPGFDKRKFNSAIDADELVWKVSEDDGSVAGAIRGQLRTARRFFGLD